jgi:hypothetical protein
MHIASDGAHVALRIGDRALGLLNLPRELRVDEGMGLVGVLPGMAKDRLGA